MQEAEFQLAEMSAGVFKEASSPYARDFLLIYILCTTNKQINNLFF